MLPIWGNTYVILFSLSWWFWVRLIGNFQAKQHPYKCVIMKEHRSKWNISYIIVRKSHKMMRDLEISRGKPQEVNVKGSFNSIKKYDIKRICKYCLMQFFKFCIFLLFCAKLILISNECHKMFMICASTLENHYSLLRMARPFLNKNRFKALKMGSWLRGHSKHGGAPKSIYWFQNSKKHMHIFWLC